MNRFQIAFTKNQTDFQKKIKGKGKGKGKSSPILLLLFLFVILLQLLSFMVNAHSVSVSVSVWVSSFYFNEMKWKTFRIVKCRAEAWKSGLLLVQAIYQLSSVLLPQLLALMKIYRCTITPPLHRHFILSSILYSIQHPASSRKTIFFIILVREYFQGQIVAI